MDTSAGARRTLGLLTLLLGLVLLIGTGVGVGFWVVDGAGLIGGLASRTGALQFAGIGGLGLTLSLTALLLGGRLFAGRPLGPFRARYFWVLLALFPLLLIGGTLAALWEKTPGFLLGAVHLATLLALPALILGALGRSLGRYTVSWQDVLGGLLSGATFGAGVAVLLEMGVMVSLALLLLVAGQIPREWMTGSPFSFQTPEDAMALVASIPPAVILVGAVFLVLLTPLVEEVTKTMVVGIGSLWLRPTPLRAFFLGAASGAGFALAENFLNGGFLGSFWGGGVLARLAATVMHVATGALMGWGWGQWGTERKYLRLPLAFLGAAGLHGLWNGTAAVLLGVVYVFFRTMEPSQPRALLNLFLLMFLALLAVAFQALLFLGVSVALFAAARRLRRLGG